MRKLIVSYKEEKSVSRYGVDGHKMSPAPQPPDDTASISSAGQESPSEYSVEEVSLPTKNEFSLEKVYLGGENDLIDGLRSLANKFLFSIATRGRGEVRCSQVSNTRCFI